MVKGEEFGKDFAFYRARGIVPNILSESRDNHALLRRQLSHGFSDKSLRAQEDIITGYIDLLIRRLKERCPPAEDEAAAAAAATVPAAQKTAFDLKHWYNFTTFDVIGDLAFGEPFGCLERGELDEHVAFLDGGLHTANQTQFVKEIGLERGLTLILRRVMKFRANLIQNMSAVLRRRMDLNAERPDLIEGLLKKQEDWVSRMTSDRSIGIGGRV